MMKYYKIKKIALSGFISVVLILSMCVFAFAASPSEIAFGKNFTFDAGSNDLFTNFKGLVPGEDRSQQINIKNTSSDSAKFYLKMEAAPQNENLSEEEKNLVYDLLYNRIKIKITDENKNLIYSGSIGGDANVNNQSTTTSKPLTLGEVASNKTKTITVELVMDGDIGNEYKGLSGNVRWVFIAEQNGKTDDIIVGDNDIPLGGLPGFGTGNGNDSGNSILGGIINTNDPSNIIMWSIILVASIFAIAYISYKKERQKNTRRTK